jgi:molecular chaperone IbpA
MHPFENEWNKYVPSAREEHFRSSQPPQVKTKPLTIEDLFPKLDRWSIGYTSTFDTLQQLAKAAKPSYPPYNITKLKEGKWQIEMALAGFRKDDIEIKVQERTLTVSSEVEPPEETYGEVIHHGIAQRNFTTNFALAEYVEVDEAKMEDGILTIKLVTNLPEEKKPKVIEIN